MDGSVARRTARTNAMLANGSNAIIERLAGTRRGWCVSACAIVAAIGSDLPPAPAVRSASETMAQAASRVTGTRPRVTAPKAGVYPLGAEDGRLGGWA
jgi:hypothetical protein